MYSPWFDTPHDHDFAHFCTGFGLPHTLAATRDAFVTAFQQARHAGGPHIIEVCTDKEEGFAAVNTLREAAKAAVRQTATAQAL